MEFVDKLKQARQMFGDDVIIVHRPEEVNNYIASSNYTPGHMTEVLEDLVDRMEMKS